MKRVSSNVAATVNVFLNHTSVTEIETVMTTAMKTAAPPVSINVLLRPHDVCRLVGSFYVMPLSIFDTSL